jgi:integrase
MKGIYKRGSKYQVKLKLPEYDKRITGTFDTEGEAGEFIKKVKAAALLGKPLEEALDGPRGNSKVSPNGMTIQQLFDRVDKKRWLGNPRAKSGMDGPRANAERYVRWCGPKMAVAEALSDEQVAAFVRERKEVYRNSGGTVNRYLASISALASEAVKLDEIKRKPELPKDVEGRARMRVFSHDEIEAILKVCRQWGYDDHAELFAFLADTGLRPGEAYKLKWDDFAGAHVHLEGTITKNSTPRSLKLTKRAQVAVAKMRERQPDNKGPFSWAHPKLRETRTLWVRLRGHFEWGPECVVYTFRHTCASNLVRKGIDLYRVMIWMGHSTLSVTQRYAKFAPKHMDELADVLE